MEEYKQKEIEYYNKEAEEAGGQAKESGSLGGFDPSLLSSYKYLQKLVAENCRGKSVLDFGCGMGIHIPSLAKVASEVTGIDLSGKSLQIAQNMIVEQNIQNAKTMLMDAEKLNFPDASFDVVFDGGTFSSINLDKAILEIKRVLKPGGVLIGIETFGHNPLTNLKRLLNKKSGRRTEWATGHIVKEKDIAKIASNFGEKQVKYFHLISWLAFPVLNLPGGKVALKIGEALDVILSIIPFLRKYSFKIVFMFKKMSN